MTHGEGVTLTCDVCGKDGARIRYVARSYGKGKSLFVIENVPVVSCPHCGESYLTADTLHEIERIKLHRQSFASERPVLVAEFAQIAELNVPGTAHVILSIRDRLGHAGDVQISSPHALPMSVNVCGLTHFLRCAMLES